MGIMEYSLLWVVQDVYHQPYDLILIRIRPPMVGSRVQGPGSRAQGLGSGGLGCRLQGLGSRV